MKKFLRSFQDQAAYNIAKQGEDFHVPCVSLIGGSSLQYDPLTSPEMVDLGLTSGILWAANNVGAEPGSTPESYYGNYYAWGETETKSVYSWDTYAFDDNGTLTKYTSSDGKTVLETVDDVVTQTYGADYRMPTKAELDELINGTDKAWVTNYNGISGLNGYKFMKKSDHSIFIFIPTAGDYGPNINHVGIAGYVWSSTLDLGNNTGGYSLSFYDGSVSSASAGRNNGFSVRAVKVQ